MSVHQLPGEVWIQVLGYLCVADKHSVRATCIDFRELVDCGLLWKDWTIVLAFPKASYNSPFWEMLRRRKINKVVVRSTRAKDWRQLARCLPSITTVVMERSSQEILDVLKNFTHLKHLAVRCSCTSLLLTASAVHKAERLTHLSICRVQFPSKSIEHLISAFIDFRNLTSLVCHDTELNEECTMTTYLILGCLPRLKHLSLTCGRNVQAVLRHTTPLPVKEAHALSSLELIHCDHSLPQDAMKLLPNLQRLVLIYKYSDKDFVADIWFAAMREDLKAWLSALHRLSTLVIKLGPHVNRYVPNLIHLHIDPWPSCLGTITAEIPQLFPKLQSLKIRGKHVPEEDFLGFQKMADLRYVEMLDSRPQFSEMAAKLQVLTKYRVQVIDSHQRDILDCDCSL
ncbi:uncharacterized protein LOC133483215 [Phyllopteryx taeniolatus]|uniref:uncharacterized protein LOC133483215 n=1 Tax=Phyllopteryx taeniolatus TaxID=161469 RepID=UPI002AD45C68|nr:uncharacterized protein LOC133483215 [Phyllopteryx taeniolatus]